MSKKDDHIGLTIDVLRRAQASEEVIASALRLPGATRALAKVGRKRDSVHTVGSETSNWTFGLSQPLANALTSSSFASRADLVACYLAGRLLPLRYGGEHDIARFGPAFARELYAWLGVPAPVFAVKNTQVIQNAITLLREHGYTVIAPVPSLDGTSSKS